MVLDVYPSTASGLSASPGAPQQFCDFVGVVAQRYRSVKTFIVLNEPNQPRFLQPQFDASGRNVAAPLAEQTLALCYDTLKADRPVDHRRRPRDLTARQRQAGRREQRLELAGAVHEVPR